MPWARSLAAAPEEGSGSGALHQTKYHAKKDQDQKKGEATCCCCRGRGEDDSGTTLSPQENVISPGQQQQAKTSDTEEEVKTEDVLFLRPPTRAAKKRQKVTALWDTDEDEEVRLVAAVPPSQVGQQGRLRRLQRQLKQRRSNAAGPSWSRRDMLDYNTKLRNTLEQQDLGRTVQGAARAPAAVRVAPEEDSDDD